ncbi:hypothetical protein G4B88_030335 [Cannabis sativa]|uniref:Uncharacterized protein n=1 Tax=Cannabis sativa TaxID=3483 RepID=A0A7J6EBC4_CANSA|nr:hypothetical protein G4B88_030335 [Cannabis sativa]
MILVNAKPETGRLWAFISVTEDEKGMIVTLIVLLISKPNEDIIVCCFPGEFDHQQKGLDWKALHMSCNLDICNNESQTSAVLACLVFT